MSRNNVIEPEQILKVAEMLLPAFIEAHRKELEGREGVYMSILKKDGVGGITAKLIGDIHSEKLDEKIKFSMEKINRLYYRNKDQSLDSRMELSSFESEDIEKKQFGGGITCKDYYMSVSGFPPHLDQKFILLVALCVGQITFKQAHDIYERSYLQQQKWIKK